MSPKQIAKIVVTAVLVASGIWLAQDRQFYTEAAVSIFFACTLMSVVVIHFRIRPSWGDALLILCWTSLFAAIDFQLLHYKLILASWLSFAGLGSLVILGVRTVWAEGASRKLLALGFVPALLLVGSEYFADNLLNWTAAAHPNVLDLYLYSFDASLGLQFPFLVGQSFARWPFLRVTSLIFYIGLAIPISVVYVGRLLRSGEKAVPSFAAFLATGPMGVLFYNLFPALGPIHLFRERFPWQPLLTGDVSRLFVEPVKIVGPPNAIPSLHMAWVLLVWWYSRGLSWWERGVAFAFLAFTVLATLGTGEHYFVDLVVAFPFAVLVEAVCSFSISWKDKRRRAAVIGALLCTLIWLAALRYGTHFFWVSPVAPWASCLATIAFSLVLERRLHRQLEWANEVPLQLNAPLSKPVATN
jgi:PAP2 superfamily